MWGRVSNIAGKGVVYAGEGLNKAVEAASYMSDVIATAPDDLDGRETSSPQSPGLSASSKMLQPSEAAARPKEETQLSVAEAPQVPSSLEASGDAYVRPHAYTPVTLEPSEASRLASDDPRDGVLVIGDGRCFPEEEGLNDTCLDVAKLPCSQEIDGEKSDADADDKNVHTRSEEKRNQQLFQALEDGKLHKVHRLTEVDGEAKNLAIKTGDPHMDVVGLRQSLRDTEDEARKMRDYSRTQDLRFQELQHSMDTAYTELFEVFHLMAKVDAASVKGSSTELPELARAAACSLQQAVTREKTWAIRLEKLIGTSDFRSGLQNIANCQQVDTLLKALEDCAARNREKSTSAEQEARSAHYLNLEKNLREAESRVTELREELRRQEHITSQLKQVIDQMREISRDHSREASSLRQDLLEAIKAKETAQQKAAIVVEESNGLRVKLDQAQQGVDQLNASDEKQNLLLEKLKLAQEHADDARATVEQSERTSMEKLASLEVLYQTALQREQQLGSQVKALSADLALANQDRARHETALGNLRGVLEEFHAERQTELHVTEARLKKEMQVQAGDFEASNAGVKARYEIQLLEFKREAEKDVLAERRARAMKEGENIRLKEELHKCRAASDAALLRLQGEQDGTLDRQLVANLVVKYVGSRHNRQVLELMARVLNFTDDENELVGLTRESPSFPTVLAAVFGPDQEDHKITTEDITGNNLSDMWMDFLMAETAEETEQK